MRKSIFFISAALTAFVVAMLVGVVYAYKDLSGLNVFAQQTSNQLVSATQASTVSPQNAVDIASKYLNRTDPYSIELSSYNGAQVYKVTFKSGDVVYVGLDGQVVSTVAQPVAAYSSSSAPHKHTGGNNSASGASNPAPPRSGGGDGGGGGGDN